MGSIAALAVALPALAGAWPPNGGTETSKLTLPANGDGTSQTSNLPPKVEKGSFFATSTSTDSKFFDEVTAMLTSKPTLTARVVTCAIIYSNLVTYPPDAGVEDYIEDEPTLQLVFLHVCIHLARSLSTQPPAAHRFVAAKAGACPVAMRGAPVKITRTASGYRAVVHGQVTKPKSLGYRMTCKRTSRSLAISVKPKSAKATLARAVGTKLELGLLSASSAPGTVKIVYTAK